jgi:hypothetical protein
MKNLINKIWGSICYWRESAVLFPASIILLLGGIYGINLLTGRPILDSPDVLVGLLYNCVGVVFVIMLTGFTKPLLFDDIDTTNPKTPLGRCILDSLETVFLLLFFAYLVVMR